MEKKYIHYVCSFLILITLSHHSEIQANWLSDIWHKIRAYLRPYQTNNPAQKLENKYPFETPITSRGFVSIDNIKQEHIPTSLDIAIKSATILIKGVEDTFSYNYTTYNLDSDDINVTTNNGKWHISEKKSSAINPHTFFEFRVPKGCNIKMKLKSGDIHIDTIENDIDIELDSGNVFANNISSKTNFTIKEDGMLDILYQPKTPQQTKCTIQGNSITTNIVIPHKFCVVVDSNGIDSKTLASYSSCKESEANIIVDDNAQSGKMKIIKR